MAEKHNSPQPAKPTRTLWGAPPHLGGRAGPLLHEECQEQQEDGVAQDHAYELHKPRDAQPDHGGAQGPTDGRHGALRQGAGMRGGKGAHEK